MEAALASNKDEIYYGELFNLGNEYLEKDELSKSKEIFEYLAKEIPCRGKLRPVEQAHEASK